MGCNGRDEPTQGELTTNDQRIGAAGLVAAADRPRAGGGPWDGEAVRGGGKTRQRPDRRVGGAKTSRRRPPDRRVGCPGHGDGGAKTRHDPDHRVLVGTTQLRVAGFDLTTPGWF